MTVPEEQDRLVNLVLREAPSAQGKGHVPGWEVAEILREGVNDGVEAYDSFETLEEVAQFVKGSGKYSDSPGFAYTGEDREEINSEGFFQEPYCPECIRELEDTEPEDFDKDELTLSRIAIDYTRPSAKLGASEKHIQGTGYICLDHQDYQMRWTQSEHI